jgi:hypothetical protein
MNKLYIVYGILFLIVLCIFFIYIGCNNYDYYGSNIEPMTTNKKLSFLHLVLFSQESVLSPNDSSYYECMRETTSPYYQTFPNVKTIYYTFSDIIQTDYELKDNVLYIKGKETYLPGILDKTIKAFEYFQNEYMNYDYVIRSNISTIINFNLLNSELLINPVEYGGSKLLNLQWLDDNSGIIDDTWFGTIFQSGTSIVFSKNAFQKVLKHKSHIRYNLIDDVALGVLFKEHIPEIEPTSFPSPDNKFVYVNSIENNRLSSIVNNHKYIFYRNRTESREQDCIQMKKIIHYLQEEIP